MAGSIDILKYSMDKAKFITIGYSYKRERDMYNFLKDYNPTYINFVEYMDIEQINTRLLVEKRNSTINDILDIPNNKESISLFNNSYKDIIVLDLSNIITPRNTNITGYRSHKIDQFVSDLRDANYGDTGAKIILLNHINRSPIPSHPMTQLSSRTSVHLSDLILVFNDGNEIEIIKNRYA
jgi:hypothetical protein